MEKKDKSLTKRERKQQKKLQKKSTNKDSDEQNSDKGEQLIDNSKVEELGGQIDYNQLLEENSNPDFTDVSFLIAEIREEYYHSMKTVLKRFGEITGSTEAELASDVLEFGSFGNVALADDEEEEEEDDADQNSKEDEQEEQDDQLNAYSVLTILKGSNKLVGRIKNLGIKSLEKMMTNKKQSEAVLQKLKATACHLLVSSRLPNLPAFVVMNSHMVFASELEELRKSNKKTYTQKVGDYLFNVSEVQVESGQTQNLDKLIYSKFEDYEFCTRSVKWWVGEKFSSQKKKVDLRRLYFVIKVDEYFKGVANIKNYLTE